MNNVTKGFIIAACVCIMLGMAATVGALAAGGLGLTKQMVENGDLRYGFFRNGDYGWNWGWDDEDDEGFFDQDHSIATGDTQQTADAKDVRDLDIEIGAGRIVMKETAGQSIEMKTEGIRKIQIYTENQTLYIKGLKSYPTSGGTIYIDIPKGMVFNDISIAAGASDVSIAALEGNDLTIELGAGQIVIDRLICDENSIEIGAGNVEIKNGKLKNAEISVGMGGFTMTGSVTGDLDGECGMGNFYMNLTGSERDHNYDLECAAGNITVGDSHYSGLASDRIIDNQANSDFTLDCSLGNVEVHFEER